MARYIRRVGVSFLVAMTAACAGKTSSPVAPVGVSALTIQTNGEVLLGAGVRFAALATSTDGSSTAASGSWTSDAPSVAAVDSATGIVTGVSVGRASISIDYGGHRATTVVVVRPNYAGNWVGRYAVAGCQTTRRGGSASCEERYVGPGEWDLQLTLTQSAGVVSGRVFIGSPIAPPTNTAQLDMTNPVVSGVIAEDGRLRLQEKQTMYSWFLPVPYGYSAYQITADLDARSSTLAGSLNLWFQSFKDPAIEASTGVITRVSR